MEKDKEDKILQNIKKNRTKTRNEKKSRNRKGKKKISYEVEKKENDKCNKWGKIC